MNMAFAELPCATMKETVATDEVIVDTAIVHKFPDLGAGVPDP